MVVYLMVQDLSCESPFRCKKWSKIKLIYILCTI